MKTRFVLLLFGALLISVASCSKDDLNSSTTNLTLIFKSSQPAALKGAVLVSIDITDFMINVQEIEFCIDEEEEGLEVEDSTYDEIELEGPFMFDLMADGVTVQEILGSFDIPNAVYDEIEFELSPYLGGTSEHPLQGRTVFLAGNYGGTPFEAWHNSDEEIEIEFPDSSSMVMSGQDIMVYVDFHIDQIMEGLMNLDLSNAVDGNENGIIEIGPDDTDGNNDLADAILEIIIKSSDLDDDDDNENDDD